MSYARIKIEITYLAPVDSEEEAALIKNSIVLNPQHWFENAAKIFDPTMKVNAQVLHTVNSIGGLDDEAAN